MDYSFIYDEGKNDILVCTFSFNEKPEYRNILSRFSCHKIFTSDVNRMWFNKSSTFKAIKTKLTEKTMQIQPKKIIFLGTSMGGFGAILYSKHCSCNQVIAFSPSIKTEYNFFNIWADKFQQYKRELKQISNHWSALDCFQDSVSYELYCSRNNVIDRKHFDQIPNRPNITKILINARNHNSTRVLRKSGRLVPILEAHIED